MSDFYRFIVSPENIEGDLSVVDYLGQSVGVYSAMTQVLTSGVNGSSLLTGLTIPILIKQTAIDAGYYTPFDGAVLQKDVVANFLFSSTTQEPYKWYVYNTSDQLQKFLQVSDYSVDWGDGSQVQQITQYTPLSINHTTWWKLGGNTNKL